MNRPIVVAVVAGCITALYAAGLYNTYRVKEEMSTQLKSAEQVALAGETDKAEKATEELQRFWEEEESRLMLYIRHNEIDDVGKSISELKYLIRLGDPAEFCSKLDQAHALINHIWESELPLFKNIL